MKNSFINKTLSHLEYQIGLKLKLYDGVLKKFNGVKYFEIELTSQPWNSVEFERLLRLSNKYKTFEIKETGYKRAGIFLTKKKYYESKRIKNWGLDFFY